MPQRTASLGTVDLRGQGFDTGHVVKWIAINIVESTTEANKTMESEDGLSLRVRETLHIGPGLNAASHPKQHNAVTAIDLSSAENEVLRPELLEFFKSTVEDAHLTDQVRADPRPTMSSCSESRLTSNRSSLYRDQVWMGPSLPSACRWPPFSTIT